MPNDASPPTAADDFAPRPTAGLGAESTALPQTSAEYQFRLTDLLVVTAGVGLGLAGGSWMPRDIFAAVLGLVTLIGLMFVHIWPPESRLGKLVWGTLVLAYLISVAAAVLRPASFA